MSTYDKEKWIYIPDVYKDYRYVLGTRGENPLFCVGINPSTAEPDNLDNTLKSVERIAFSNGFDSFIMFNVYPQRATDPNGMHETPDLELQKENTRQFASLLGQYQEPVLWASWGNLIEKRPYLWNCLRDLVKSAEPFRPHWVSAGKVSKKGHPHHPLYLKKDEKIAPFDMNAYIRSRE